MKDSYVPRFIVWSCTAGVVGANSAVDLQTTRHNSCHNASIRPSEKAVLL